MTETPQCSSFAHREDCPRAGGECRGCRKPLLKANRTMADGCPCNSLRGVNHGLVPKDTCTCTVCDPEQTGSARRVTSSARPHGAAMNCAVTNHPVGTDTRAAGSVCACTPCQRFDERLQVLASVERYTKLFTVTVPVDAILGYCSAIREDGPG